MKSARPTDANSAAALVKEKVKALEKVLEMAAAARLAVADSESEQKAVGRRQKAGRA